MMEDRSVIADGIRKPLRSCLQCAHRGLYQNQDKSLSHVCRKNAPRVISHVVPIGPNQLQITNNTMWPTVTENDWCGDFTAEQAIHAS